MQENNPINDNSHYEEDGLFVSEELKEAADLSSQEQISTENKKDEEIETDDNTCYVIHLYFDKFGGVSFNQLKEEDKLKILTMNLNIQNLGLNSTENSVTIKFTLFNEVLKRFMEKSDDGILLEKITLNNSKLEELSTIFNKKTRIKSYFFSTNSEVPGLVSLSLSSDGINAKFF
jgi:hypothetical protein